MYQDIKLGLVNLSKIIIPLNLPPKSVIRFKSLIGKSPNLLTIRPNNSFQTFLGDRYGYRPYPSEIHKEELEILKKALKRKGKSIDVIADWFVLDENAQPAVYVLQPIHSKLPHYNDMTEANSQLAAQVCMNTSYSFLELSNCPKHGELHILNSKAGCCKRCTLFF